MAYQWNCADVLRLLGVPFKENRPENMVPCPACGGKRFAMNIAKGTGHCFNCSERADSAAYYALSTGLSIEEARKEIEERLNIKTDWKTDKRPARVAYAEEQSEEEITDSATLNAAYQSFLSELTLSDENKYNLLSRGFDEPIIKQLGYKTFPHKSERDFFALCRNMIKDDITLKGVPGFYKTFHNDWNFVQLTKGIIVPTRNINNEIVGLQIRKDDDKRVYIPEQEKLEPKCAWFSSKGFNSGAAAHGYVHYACDFRYDNGTKKWWAAIGDTIILTEGAMKADLVHYLSKAPVIAVPGVYNYKYLEEQLKLLSRGGVKRVIHCYDMDYQTNPNVKDAMIKTREIIKNCGFEYVFKTWETKVTIDGVLHDRLKGLDDYLAYVYKGIIPHVESSNNISGKK